MRSIGVLRFEGPDEQFECPACGGSYNVWQIHSDTNLCDSCHGRYVYRQTDAYKAICAARAALEDAAALEAIEAAGGGNAAAARALGVHEDNSYGNENWFHRC